MEAGASFEMQLKERMSHTIVAKTERQKNETYNSKT